MVMKFVKVRGPNNRPDRNGRGCVPYEYEIARCAISNADWCEFLNAIGEKAVAFGLWHKDMETGVLGGIVCSMTSGMDSPRIAPASQLALRARGICFPTLLVRQAQTTTSRTP